MNSAILQIASRFLKPIFLLFALLALIRGHNHPGGGFIGGLLASLSYIFSSLAYSPQMIRTKMRLKPKYFIALGLILVFISTLPGLLAGKEVFFGTWMKLQIPLLGELKLGTPFLFDIGVFFTVIGVTLLFYFSLSIKKQWKY